MELNSLNQAVDFKTIKRKVFTEDGVEVKDRKAIVRTDTNKVLGVVGNNYRIAEHSKVLEAFEQTGILKLKKVDVCKGGAVMFAHYDIENNGQLRQEDVQVGDTIRFGVRVFNSHNYDLGVGFEIVAYRLVCKNGLVVPRTMSRVSMKHYQSTDINRIRLSIVKKQDSILPTIQIWKRWSETKVDETRIDKFFEEAKVGKRLRSILYDRAVAENKRLGVWGIYNVFTHYTTHEMKVRSAENRTLSVRDKEQTLLQKFYQFDWEGELKS